MAKLNKIKIGNNYYSVAIPYGTCSIAANTAAKTVSCSNFALADGVQIKVKFTYANTAANPTLNVNSTGAVPIKVYGTTAVTTAWKAGSVVDFTYDGTNWIITGFGALQEGTATGNAGELTYSSHTQDSSNKKKFTVTTSVSAPAPTVSAGYVSAGTAGSAANKTVEFTITNAQAIASVGDVSQNILKNPTFDGPEASYSYTIPQGYHDGAHIISGSATMNSASVSRSGNTLSWGTGYITASSTEGVISVSNATTLNGYLVAANAGKYYKYTGDTTTVSGITYTKNNIYTYES